MHTLYSSLHQLISTLDVESISTERKQKLDTLVVYIQQKLSKNLPVNLIFICTHNSRRSHFAEIWAKTLSTYFELANIQCYSGGTEATALYPSVIHALRKQGFQAHQIGVGNNPIQSIKCGGSVQPIIGFSKIWDDFFNPQSDFAAVMTCAQADAECPYIAGAEKRISLPFIDPKVFDNTAEEYKGYLEKSLEVATDLYYVFSQLKPKHER